MFDLALLDAMPFTAKLTTVTARDLYGGRTFGTPIPFPCYWLDEDDDSEDQQGQERVATGKLWAPPAALWTPTPYAVVDPSTRNGVILPSGAPSNITKVTTYRDQDGVYGYEVTYG